ncbi:hypothetical protein C1Y63_03800 [Corynebacterium sp. 13CS0277]|nr:hypothetical protein C1Y63_03800 [Corynebacterium sp. 13CS0277]
MIATWAILTAQRLNRLHIRTDARIAALEAALLHRAGLVEMACPEARDAARRAAHTPLSTTGVRQRSLAERELNEVVRGTAADGDPLILAATTRVELAVRFYNEAVRDTRAMRLRPLVRLLALGGRAPMPEFYEVIIDAYGVAADEED